MDHWRMVAFFFAATFFEVIRGIKINAVNIPKVVRDGTEEPTVLDCDYEMGRSSNTGLTIKWYIGQDLLYQWVQGMAPQASDEFRKFVDASYRASDDPDTMYRAVKLLRPEPDLSGEYRCVVFTHDDEDEAQGRMLVYSPEKYFLIQHVPNPEDLSNQRLTVTCSAQGLFPKPRITLRKETEVIIDQQKDYRKRPDGRFDAEAIAVIDTKAMKIPVTFYCEIFIKEANYTAFKAYVYSGSSLGIPGPQILTVSIFVVLSFAGRQQ